MFLTHFYDASTLAYFGYIAAILGFFAFIPYAFDTFFGRSEPLRASWLIWSMLSLMSLMAQIVEGASTSLWFAVVKCGGTILIFALSIWRGKGAFLREGDEYILLAASFGLVMWAVTHSVVYTLAISIGVSFLGGVVTVIKAYRSPHTETMSCWLVSFFAASCAIVSVGKLDWVLLAYPLYLFVLNGAIVAAMVLGQVRKGRGPLQAPRLQNAPLV